MKKRALAKALERLYERYNRRELVHPDPLEFLYRYDDARDREVVGLVASSLAYGRVAQILNSVTKALAPMGDSPARFVERSSAKALQRAFTGFKHRFTTGRELARLLSGAGRLIERFGSLGEFFARALGPKDETVLPALSTLVRELRAGGLARCRLLPSPERGSACKRLLLFLRWMVRRDRVDPGGWEGVARSKLVVPLDTHMFRLSRALGFTSRRQANLRTAVEVTAGFRRLVPEDPVRYDFALTRLGIRPEADGEAFLRECGVTAPDKDAQDRRDRNCEAPSE